MNDLTYKNNEIINEESKTVKENPNIKYHADIICKLTSSYYYVHENELIIEVADDLDKNESIESLCVVNDKKEPPGYVTRKYLFNNLGRRHGRDVFKYKRIKDFLKEAQIFYYDKNLFSVVKKAENSLYMNRLDYYILKDHDEKYFGIFSSRDMLIYLSKITEHDIELAKKMQSNIVKKNLKESNDKIDIAGVSRMAKGIGGDFYTVKKTSDKEWIMMVCDVTGKGIAASLVSAIIGGMFSMFKHQKNLKTFIKSLNSYIFETFQVEKYLTGFFIHLNIDTGKMSIFDMGHASIIIIRNNKIHTPKTTMNIPIGLRPEIKVKSNKIMLKKEDKVLVFTDGLTDQKNSLEETYGENSLINILKKNSYRAIKDIKKEILDDFDKFRGDFPQFDDITFILFEYKNNN